MEGINHLKELIKQSKEHGLPIMFQSDELISLLSTILKNQALKDKEAKQLFEQYSDMSKQQIESQKEEIEKKDAALLAWMEREDMLKRLYDRLESKKLIEQEAITELAIKGLKQILGISNMRELDAFDIGEIRSLSEITLSEIERRRK
jgi:hypothetical protein